MAALAVLRYATPPLATARSGLTQVLGRMGTLFATVLILALVLAVTLLFATSGSLRAIVQRLMPEYEPRILLPATDWYMPYYGFGGLRPIALFRKQPSVLMSSSEFRSTLAQARFLATFTLLGMAAFFIYALAA